MANLFTRGGLQLTSATSTKTYLPCFIFSGDTITSPSQITWARCSLAPRHFIRRQMLHFPLETTGSMWQQANLHLARRHLATLCLGRS